jgi:CarboxypepD_reg-like domain
MLSVNVSIFKKIPAIALFIIILLSHKQAVCQVSILDSTFSFKAGIIETGKALDIISNQTGFNFTYDSRLIDGNKMTEMNFSEDRLETILNGILQNDSLSFSVIDKYIIISFLIQSPKPLSNSSMAGETIYLTGRIIDNETLQPLPFATIVLKNTGRGTVSNNNGVFGLQLNPDLPDDTLSVSYLGYFGREISVIKSPGNDLTIKMKRDFIPISEIIIKTQIPQEIISKARLSIAQNYSAIPAYLSAFYREGVMKKNQLQNYSEAVLLIYKTAYPSILRNGQIKIYKSRKIDNTDIRDTLTVRLKAGLSTCLTLDGVKNNFDFITLASMPEYTYRITDIVTYNDEAAYVIEFEQRDFVDIPLYKGSVYINTDDFAILHAEFELNQKFIHKIKESFIANSSRGFNTRPVSAKYSVSYRKMNNTYYLSHIRGDLLFTAKQKKRLFNTQFKVFFELAVTDINLKNVTRFDKEERAPVHSIFSRTINNYDPFFWEGQDFLQPEDNLLQALKNMNVKLQTFTK